MFKKLWKNEKGFTLMEIVIVIVILGILALLAIPRLLGFTDQAEIANDKEYAAVVARAGELYWASHDEELEDLDPGAIDNVGDAVETLLDANLIDSPASKIQYEHGGNVFDNITIAVSGAGVATVVITYDTDVTITFDSVNGYDLNGL